MTVDTSGEKLGELFPYILVMSLRALCHGDLASCLVSGSWV